MARILHVFRSPVGGLFRHVLDLASGQVERGHTVGIVCDTLTGGQRAEAALSALAPRLALGVTRLPMPRNPHPADLVALLRLSAITARLRPDVVHGHGSKGGLYARLLPFSKAVRAYTPHGGSFNYGPGHKLHGLFMGAERLLARRTDVFLFESAYVRDRFVAFVGPTRTPARIVRNGLGPHEFEPVVTADDPHDLLYIGELRALKGIDTLIAAVGLIRSRGRTLRLLLVGAGPDEAELRALIERAGMAATTSFMPPQPIREAMAKARVMAVPSRAESLPYVVLEAAAAAKPLVSTDVGGIPEIFGPFAQWLIHPDEPEAMAAAILDKLDMTETDRKAEAEALQRHVRSHFSLDDMVDGVLAGYEAARHDGAHPRPGVKPSVSRLPYPR